MLNFKDFFKLGSQNKLTLRNHAQLAYAGQWKRIYPDTEIDRWYVGDYSSANYTITAEFSSNKKETLQVLVVARPDQATVTVYGRTSIDDALINITATVSNSVLRLVANVTDTSFSGTKLIFFAQYAQCILPLTLPEAVSFVDSSGGGGYDGGGGIGGAATSFSQLSGTIGLSQIPNGLITPAKFNLNNGLIPTANETYDLGSAANRWRDLYLSGSSIKLGAATITATGSSIALPAGTTVGGAAIAAAVNSFGTVAVSGQSNVAADLTNDTLTLVAGPGIQLTTNASTDTITITNTGSGGGPAAGVSAGTAGRLTYYAATGSVVQDTGANLTWNGSNLNITGTVTATGDVSYVRAYFDTLVALQAISAATWHGMVAHVHEGGGRMYYAHGGAWQPMSNFSDLNIFKTIAVAGQSNVVADTATDTLTLVAGTNVSITTNATTDTITINATGSAVGNLDSLTDVVITGVSSGQVLKYNGVNWINDTDATGGGGGNLDSLTDVVITGVSSGQVLKYNGVNWINDTDATGSGGSNSFETIAVAGQSNVSADSTTDTLTLAAGTGITLTTNAGTDTITITNSGTQQPVFSTIAVSGQSNVEADTIADTLTLVAGSGISITTNAGTDTVTITNSASAGATTFAALTDNAGLTADRFYLPAITQLAVTANSSSAYRFDQYGTVDNPTIYAISGTTIAFDLSVGLGSHPFLIRLGSANYNTGLVHVTTGGTVTTGSAAQGKTSGTLYWKLPANISGTYGYLCGNHGTMIGTITVKDISAI